MGRFGSLIAVVSFSALAACSTGKPVEPQLVASPDTVSLMLADAADKASTALETLAAVEQKQNPKAGIEPIPDAPPELRRAMTVSWTGPTEQIVRKLANRAGYSFFVLGNRPPVPLVVSIDVENRPVIEILRSVGLQLGNRANLKVDARRQVIEIQYVPLTSVGMPG